MNQKLILKRKSRITEYCGSQANLAQELDCHESEVSRIINGRRSIKVEDRPKWLKALKLSEKQARELGI